MILRWAELPDRDALVRFTLALAGETEELELDRSGAERGVEAALADPDRGRHLVAEDPQSGQLLGALMLTREWGDWYGAWYWWIQSVYVPPQARRQGVFQALYQEARRRAREAGVRALRLYVDQDNRPAMDTYRRLGMQASPYLMFEDRLNAGVISGSGEKSG